MDWPPVPARRTFPCGDPFSGLIYTATAAVRQPVFDAIRRSGLLALRRETRLNSIMDEWQEV
jgi:hypothetical protein